MKFAPLLLLLTSFSVGAAQTAPAGNASMVRNEIAALEFIGGGSPLTPQERQVAAEIVSTGMKNRPELWTAANTGIQEFLAAIAKGNSVDNRSMREASRYNYAFNAPNYDRLGEQFVMEKRIIDAPTPAFDTRVTADLKQQLSSVEPSIGDGIAHIERDSLYTQPYFFGLASAQKTNLFVTLRATTFPNLADSASLQWPMAEAAGMLSRFAATQTQTAMIQGTTSSLLRSQQRQLNALHNAAVGASPACNVTNGSYEDRAAAGCYK